MRLRNLLVCGVVLLSVGSGLAQAGVPDSTQTPPLTDADLLGLSAVSDSVDGWTLHRGMYVRSSTLAAFKKMRRAAVWSFLRLRIVSAYRSYDRQRMIWERKWADSVRTAYGTDSVGRALSILEYSSMPGTSRHHWGTDIDINSVENDYFETRRGRRLYRWLVDNAGRFGFFQPYTPGRTKGYLEEPWHWSYSPVADQYYDAYLQRITPAHINGFEGCGVADTLNVIDGWVKL